MLLDSYDLPKLDKSSFLNGALVESEWSGLVDRAKSIKFDELSRLNGRLFLLSGWLVRRRQVFLTGL